MTRRTTHSSRPSLLASALVLAVVLPATAFTAAPPATPPASPSGPSRPQLPARRPAAPEVPPPGVAPSGAPTGDPAKPAGGAAEPVAKAPKPREILDAHIKAIGGEDAVRKQSSRTQSVRIEMPAMPQVNQKVSFKAKAPDMLLVNMASPMGEMQQGFDGKVGWAIMPGQGPMILSGKQLAQMKLEADFHRDLNLFNHFPSAETVGQRDFGGGKCWHVRFSGGEHDPMNLFFDQGTGLMRGYESTVDTPMGQQSAQMVIMEWKDVDGVKHPSKMEQSAMGMTQLMIVESIDTSPIDDSVFALPPTVKAILDRQKESGDPSKAPPVAPGIK